MSREKQIEEMAKVMRSHCEIDNQCGSCHFETCNECFAEVLYNAGYRKASEIFQEIENEIKNHGICYAHRKIAELKKKYMEEEK